MDTVNYFVRSTELGLLLYGVYFLLLRQRTFHRLNRFYLLLSGLAVLLWPLCQLNVQAAGQTTYVLAPVAVQAHMPVVPAFANAAPLNGIPGFWSTVYVSGLVFSLCWLVFRLLRLYLMLRGASATADPGVYHLPPGKNLPPCSFMHRIYLPAGLPADEYNMVLRHERVHVREFHSADILFYELLCAVFWFNPLYRLALKALMTNHEFIADREAGGNDTVSYAQLLVSRALGIPVSVFHSFSIHQNLKRRLFMLNKKQSSKRAAWLYLAAIPALATGFFVQSFTFSEKAAESSAAVSAPAEKDREASFKGGTQALQQYLVTNIRYPEAAKNKNVSGQVFVGFTVDENGHVKNAVLKRKVHELLDAEALRVVSSMPDWEPAVKDGKKISTSLVLPIRFELEKK